MSNMFHLRVEADLDASLPGRVLARVTMRNELPDRFSFCRSGAEALSLELSLPYTGAGEARRLAQQIAAIPSVRALSLSRDGCAVDLDPSAPE